MTDQDLSKEALLAKITALEERNATLERRLRDRPEQDDLVQSINGIVWEVEIGTARFSFVSDKAEQILGYSCRDWLESKGFWEAHIHPDDREETVAYCKSETQALRDHRLEYRMLAADGRSVWIRDFVTVVVEDGRPTKLRGVMVDATATIAERERSEAELRQGEERYRTVVESMSEGLLITDVDDIGLFVNSRLAQMTGFAPDEFIGRKVHQLLLPPEKWPDILERHSQRLQGQLETYEMEITRKDGTLLWVLVNAAPYPGPDGQPSGAIVVFADLTEHRQIESELRQSQKMEVIGQLTSGVAHNFNNLLVPIQGNLELVLPHCPEELKPSVEDAHDASLRAADLVRQLMTYSRRQSLFPQHEPLAPAAVLGEVAEICRTTFDRAIAVDFAPPENLPAVLGDASQLHTVFLNLCLNARDALTGLEDRTPTIGLRADLAKLDDAPPHPDARAGTFVRIELSDNGTGIDAETQGRIFDPFFTTKEVGQGTGLGLSTAYGIIRQHNGWIECRSRPGAGTTFTLYLPATDASPPVSQTERPAEIEEGSGTILIIDDEELVRNTVSRLLTRHQYEVLTATDGAGGIELFRARQGEISLVFLDLSMPGLTGRQVLDQLRSIDPQVKVVVFTGHTAAAKEFADVPFLTKPLRNQTIIRTVQDLLNSRF